MIRNAKAQDSKRIEKLLGDILKLHQDLHPEHFEDKDIKYNQASIEMLIEDETTLLWVHEGEQGVDAYVIAWVEDGVLFVDDLCVDQTIQTQGIGSQLMEALEDYARLHALRGIQLNVWIRNESARRFYDRMGFGVLKEVRFRSI